MASPSLTVARISRTVDALGFQLFPFARLKIFQKRAWRFHVWKAKNQLGPFPEPRHRRSDGPASTEYFIKK
jgi:hypothetical protein